MPSTTTSDDWPKPSHILEFFERMEHVLAAHRAQLEANVAQESPFFGLAIDELDNVFAELRQELEHEVVTLLAASFEANFVALLANECGKLPGTSKNCKKC